MNKLKLQRYVRKFHRYLGVVLGVQFILWTAGGLYFSWSDIEKIRGEDIKADKQALPIESDIPSLGILLDSLILNEPEIAFEDIHVVEILGKAFYQIHIAKPLNEVRLYDMKDLKIKSKLTEKEAIEVAMRGLKQPSNILNVKYIEQTDSHHEYRDKPLPAYAITFDRPNNTTVYVAAELGTVQSYRSNGWRIFDFLWMFHTMDYEGRDNFNNLLLRIFSLMGLITLFSGFLLYFLTIQKNIVL